MSAILSETCSELVSHYGRVGRPSITNQPTRALCAHLETLDMKKIVLAFALVTVALAACGGGKTDANNAASSATAAAETVAPAADTAAPAVDSAAPAAGSAAPAAGPAK